MSEETLSHGRDLLGASTASSAAPGKHVHATLSCACVFLSSRNSGVKCVPWVENLERISTSKRDPVPSKHRTKGRNQRESEAQKPWRNSRDVDAGEDNIGSRSCLLRRGEKEGH